MHSMAETDIRLRAPLPAIPAKLTQRPRIRKAGLR